MVIDFTQKLTNIVTKKVFVNDDKTDLTLMNVACNALFANIEEEKIDGQEKLKRYELASKIIKNPKFDLMAEEIVKIKELTAKVYGTMVVGIVYKILEGKGE